MDEATKARQQEAFNKAYLGLKSQGFQRSEDHNGYCAYRGLAGLRCAIGQLIADKDYDSFMEGKAAVVLLGGGLLPRYLSDLDEKFLHTLQKAHDRGYKPAVMEQRLCEFAKFFGLTVPE